MEQLGVYTYTYIIIVEDGPDEMGVFASLWKQLYVVRT